MKKTILVAVACAVFLLSGCTSRKAAVAVAPAHQTTLPSALKTSPSALPCDSLAFADSLVLGASKADFNLGGRYPSATGSILADSLRTWLFTSLSSQLMTDSPIPLPSSPLLADGQPVATRLGAAFMDARRKEFGSLPQGDGYSAEYVGSFGPSFLTPKVVTFFATVYTYDGGAHGRTVAFASTFRRDNGRSLTAASMFRPSALSRVVAMVRDALWTQYFAPTAADSGISSLKEALLIAPDSLTLPAFPPTFSAKGVVFTYGQYEIAPYAAGMPTCVIPYSSLLPCMTMEAASLIP